MAFFIGEPAVGAPGQIHTSILNELGTIRKASDGNTYIYLTGVASTVLGSWVTYDEAYLTVNLATDSKPRPVAIATAATVANTYGWYGIKGAFICGAISGGDAAVDAPVYATATDFLTDDVELDDMVVLGAFYNTQEGEASAALGLSATAALATARIDEPWFGLAIDASA